MGVITLLKDMQKQLEADQEANKKKTQTGHHPPQGHAEAAGGRPGGQQKKHKQVITLLKDMQKQLEADQEANKKKTQTGHPPPQGHAEAVGGRSGGQQKKKPKQV